MVNPKPSKEGPTPIVVPARRTEAFRTEAGKVAVGVLTPIQAAIATQTPPTNNIDPHRRVVCGTSSSFSGRVQKLGCVASIGRLIQPARRCAPRVIRGYGREMKGLPF